MAKVSVIIPNYNHACYLEQRIQSVIRQTYPNFEIIILDDCSPDHSVQVIERLRHHPKISKVIYNSVNSGSTFKQWQRGIQEASGDYVWIAESDDWCEPTLLETLMQGLLQDPSVGIAFCQSCYYYEDNRVKEYTHYPYYANTENGNAFIQQYMLKGNNVVNASMAVWKKDLYHQVSPLYTQFKFCGDWLFWISLMQQSNVFVSGRVLNYFRNHDKDVSSKFYNTGNSFIENIRFYNVLLDRSVITPLQFRQLIKRQYVQFLSAKSYIVKDNIATIDAAFRQQTTLNLPTQWYCQVKKQLYMAKQYLLLQSA
jgi:glycosyltransferase involved in cell wall biosynthesis